MSFLTSRTRSAPHGVGQPVLRKEDRRLVTGGGCYSDDFTLPGQAYASFVRSPHAHARIRRIEIADAVKVPGVIAVFTGDDAVADGLKAIPHPAVPTNPHELRIENRDGTPLFLNAIVDALAELGVEHIEMPATPERVWRAIRAAHP